jgi:uncharacterized protein (DUF1778 family)
VQKTRQLQIRVSPAQKLAIQRQAERARMSMSEWILDKLLPSSQATFQSLVEALAASDQPSFVFAELLDVLGPMNAEEFEVAVSEPPRVELDPYWRNYVAATVEHAAATKQARAPSWTRDIAPLDEPVFGSSLASLRLHLLVNSPPAFAARNIFIDSSVGERV